MILEHLMEPIDIFPSNGDEFIFDDYNNICGSKNAYECFYPMDIHDNPTRNYASRSANIIGKRIESKLNSWWVTGFTDAEGSFGIKARTRTGTGLDKPFASSLEFKVTQNKPNEHVLFKLKEYFGVGNVVIDNSSTNTIKYQVQRLQDIREVIVPHFDKYSLVTSKHLDFQDWKSVSEIISNKNQYDNEYIKKNILDLKSNINSQRSEFSRWKYLSSIFKDKNLEAKWLQGFIDGEGTFQFGLGNSISRGTPYIRANPTIEISQSNHDVIVLKIIQEYLDGGYLKPKYDITNFSDTVNSRSVSRYVTNDESAVIRFIDENPLLTNKNLDYEDWKRLVEIKRDGLHKNEDTLAQMKAIKQGINSGRGKSF